MMLYELKGFSVVCPYDNFFLLKSLSHIVFHPFQITRNINGSARVIQDTRNIQKRKAT